MTAGDGVRALTALEPKVKEAVAAAIDTAESVVAADIALATGSVFVGAAGIASALDAKGTGKVLIGNGTTVTSQSVTGVITLDAAGATTLPLARGSVLRGSATGLGEALDAKTAGRIMVGDGTDIVSVAVSGDVTLAAGGAVTIGNDKVTEQKMLIALPVAVPIPATLAVRMGAQADGVAVGLVTRTAAADVTQEDNSGVSFIDETADAASAGANDVEIPDPFDTDDALYMGYSAKFFGVAINIGTQGAGDAAEAETEWEYYTGAAWAALTEVIDDTVALTAAPGVKVVTFLPPANWATVAVDGGTAMYFVRMRATAADVYNTTQPKITQLWVMPVNAGQGMVIPFDCVIEAIDLFALTASATNNDTELLLVNATAGTFAQVTWTGGDAMDRVTGLTLAFTAGDQLLVAIINEDGTTEFASVTLTLQALVG